MKTILTIAQICLLFHFSHASKKIDFNFQVSALESMYNCLASAPSGIQDLKDGVVIDAYDFFDGDEKALSLLGFLNVDIKKQERITVIEYLQKGSVYCNGKRKKYGIGARLMMRVTSHKRKAKLDTPQQITASVIFGQATVKFSMHTFGITGPGVANLNRVGSITENTYSSFISGISDLLADAYKGSNQYIIAPQLLSKP
ncbi:hypothetical protein [Croceitalea rosinachiae]|uniref:Secreted protein n=1 Tax=Croceitalea rosinachiae TaxID=3075596 RepID=A0ABU3A829_9FLAO|nr:hypothetical protein [Croceitalea sp. F388]MDT0606339.1 hypothetical protein [Croceitalea sp. F388]